MAILNHVFSATKDYIYIVQDTVFIAAVLLEQLATKTIKSSNVSMDTLKAGIPVQAVLLSLLIVLTVTMKNA